MRRRRITIFASCQGLLVARLLRRALPRGRWRIEHLWNVATHPGYRPAGRILAALADADYAIYQPLGPEHGRLAGPALAATLADSGPPAERIATFPRIINDGAQSLSRANPRAPEPILGQRYVTDLLARGAAPAEIKRRFAAGEIDFEQRSRFDRALERLRRQEQSRGCDVRVAAAIEREHRRRRLFLTHNHPTTALGLELCQQLAGRLGLPARLEPLRERADAEPNLAELPRRTVALTPHDVAALGYEFEPDPDWRRQGEVLIDEIVAAASRPQGADRSPGPARV